MWESGDKCSRCPDGFTSCGIDEFAGLCEAVQQKYVIRNFIY